MLDDMLPRRDEFSISLVLVARHGPITPAFERKIGLKVRVKVLLQGHVAHKSHAAQGAVELDP